MIEQLRFDSGNRHIDAKIQFNHLNLSIGMPVSHGEVIGVAKVVTSLDAASSIQVGCDGTRRDFNSIDRQYRVLGNPHSAQMPQSAQIY